MPQVHAVVSEIPSEDVEGLNTALPDKIEFPDSQLNL
jgi:hypothetical protein